MIYDWDSIKEKYVSRGEKVTAREFAKKEGINYHYLARKVEEEDWDKDRSYYLETRSLTERQKQFCFYYVQHFNRSKAYRQAFPNSSVKNANVESNRLMKKPEIRLYIKGLLEEIQEELMFDTQAIIRKYIDIAFMDIFDIIEVDGNRVNLKDDADGSIIQSVRSAPFGVDVVLADRMDALKELAKRFGLDESDLNKEIKERKIALQERKVDLQEQQLESLSNGSVQENTVAAVLEGIVNAANRETD